MDYIKWNNILASNFFNEENAEKPVNLFITKDEIIKTGELHIGNSSPGIVWNDFINAINEDLKSYNQENKLVKRANDRLAYYKSARQDYEFPPYLLYQ